MGSLTPEVLFSPFESARLRQVIGPALRPGGTLLTDRAVSFCDFGPAARLLDVGCGSGATVEHLQTRHGFIVTGLDCSRVLLDEALRRYPFLALTEGRAESLPCPDGIMDGIFCECVLSLLAEPSAALREFRRVLRPGGYLVLSDLYRRGEFTLRDGGTSPVEEAGGWMTARMLGRTLREAGFSPLLWEDHTPLLKELAARLVLAGLSPEEFCGGGCAGSSSFVTRKAGYYLLVARRER